MSTVQGRHCHSRVGGGNTHCSRDTTAAPVVVMVLVVSLLHLLVSRTLALLFVLMILTASLVDAAMEGRSALS